MDAKDDAHAVAAKVEAPVLGKLRRMQTEDNDTVRTADCSTDDESYDGIPAHGVPAVVSCPATPKTLQEKQKARYAAYLANRQQRIEAREKAEYEWEQRRLARKTAMREESLKDLASVKQCIRLNNQLVCVAGVRKV